MNPLQEAPTPMSVYKGGISMAFCSMTNRRTDTQRQHTPRQHNDAQQKLHAQYRNPLTKYEIHCLKIKIDKSTKSTQIQRRLNIETIIIGSDLRSGRPISHRTN